MEKSANAIHPILKSMARRWSPRAFDGRSVEVDKLCSLFEAARWAASSFNEQPWRFILANKQQPDEYDKALSCLVETNQSWAQSSPVLVLTFSKKTFSKDGKPNRVALHDLGLAVGNLSIQATEMGLSLHQMAGINRDRVCQEYNVPEDFEPQTAIAIGYGGDPKNLPEGWMRNAEESPRQRMDFAAFVFTGKFGQPSLEV